jgi:hypothetical protein
MNLAFLLCVENGNLENQALLLCHSIREFAGGFADAEIHAYSPRPANQPARATIDRLKELGAIHHDEPLNREFANYAIGNKIFVSAAAERSLAAETLVFLDSDTFFTQEPALFRLPPDIDAAARPVDKQNLGSTGAGDQNDSYWQRMYSICQVKEDHFVETTVDKKKIRAYFNAGLIVVRRSAGLFARWEQNFLALVAAGHMPENDKWNNMDQFALATTLSRVFKRVSTLDWKYNYPLGHRPVLDRAMQEAQLEDLVHVHYHRWFNRPNFLRLTTPTFSRSSPLLGWLEQHLPFQPTIDTPLRYIGA